MSAPTIQISRALSPSLSVQKRPASIDTASISNIAVGVTPRITTLSDFRSLCLTSSAELAAIPDFQHRVQSLKIASASSRVTSFLRLNLMKSSREVITRGRFDTVNTVLPCDENVVATVLSRPLIMVTTAITAETPTMIPTRVNAVRSLFERRLESATRRASQSAVIRNLRSFDIFAREAARRLRAEFGRFGSGTSNSARSIRATSPYYHGVPI